jgi:cbb3-type cytochrome oxidase subunit 3
MKVVKYKSISIFLFCFLLIGYTSIAQNSNVKSIYDYENFLGFSLGDDINSLLKKKKSLGWDKVEFDSKKRLYKLKINRNIFDATIYHSTIALESDSDNIDYIIVSVPYIDSYWSLDAFIEQHTDCITSEKPTFPKYNPDKTYFFKNCTIRLTVPIGVEKLAWISIFKNIESDFKPLEEINP